MADKQAKKYRVLCWGDCKQFPELGSKCYLSFAHTDKRAYEGEVVDYIPAVSVPWLLREKFIEEVSEDGGDKQ